MNYTKSLVMIQTVMDSKSVTRAKIQTYHLQKQSKAVSSSDIYIYWQGHLLKSWTCFYQGYQSWVFWSWYWHTTASKPATIFHINKLQHWTRDHHYHTPEDCYLRWSIYWSLIDIYIIWPGSWSHKVGTCYKQWWGWLRCSFENK